MEETCKTCKFWSGMGEGNLAECRKAAPVLINEEELRIWPKTYAIDWCADYEKNYNLAKTLGEEG